MIQFAAASPHMIQHATPPPNMIQLVTPPSEKIHPVPVPPLPPPLPPSLLRTCVLRRLESSALLAALISSLGALMKRNFVVEMRSELKGLLMPMDMLLRTIFTMRVSSRSLFRCTGQRVQTDTGTPLKNRKSGRKTATFYII